MRKKAVTADWKGDDEIGKESLQSQTAERTLVRGHDMITRAALLWARDEPNGSSGTCERVAHEGGDGGWEF